MLSYLHQFHAGNHADILKHIVLLYTIEYLNKKEKPYTFFDSHAGRALYDLKSEEAQKTKESEKGILKLFSYAQKNPSEVPGELKNYLDFIKYFLEKNQYPGSPLISLIKKKKDSPLFLTELHKTEFQKLEENICNAKNTFNLKNSKVFIENSSSWSSLKSKIPPLIKRGCVLIDPSYEELSDYENAQKTVCEIYKKWNAATVILWYPLLSYRIKKITEMNEKITQSVKKINKNVEILFSELLVEKEDSHIETDLKNLEKNAIPRLYGSGLLIVNPVWNTGNFLEKCLPYISNALGENASYSIKKY